MQHPYRSAPRPRDREPMSAAHKLVILGVAPLLGVASYVLSNLFFP
jgi:hypothetical protein